MTVFIIIFNMPIFIINLQNFKEYFGLSVVAQAYNIRTWEAEAGGCKFKASLDYIVRPYLQKMFLDAGPLLDIYAINTHLILKVTFDEGKLLNFSIH
jgi:hypothetical protein